MQLMKRKAHTKCFSLLIKLKRKLYLKSIWRFLARGVGGITINNQFNIQLFIVAILIILA